MGTLPPTLIRRCPALAASWSCLKDVHKVLAPVQVSVPESLVWVWSGHENLHPHLPRVSSGLPARGPAGGREHRRWTSGPCPVWPLLAVSPWGRSPGLHFLLPK